MLMTSQIIPLNSLGQDDQNGVQHDFFSCDATSTVINSCQWHHKRHHQDDQNKVQHNFSHHVTSVGSHHANSIANGATEFNRS